MFLFILRRLTLRCVFICGPCLSPGGVCESGCERKATPSDIRLKGSLAAVTPDLCSSSLISPSLAPCAQTPVFSPPPFPLLHLFALPANPKPHALLLPPYTHTHTKTFTRLANVRKKHRGKISLPHSHRHIFFYWPLTQTCGGPSLRLLVPSSRPGQTSGPQT